MALAYIPNQRLPDDSKPQLKCPEAINLAFLGPVSNQSW